VVNVMLQAAVPQGRWREPIIPGYLAGEAQIKWARCRPRHARTSPPEVGQVVGYRAQANGPVVRAKVLRVLDAPPADTRPGSDIDWNVWRYVVPNPATGPLMRDEANRAVTLHDDPWWNVLIQTLDGPALRIETREARLPGSPGWLYGKD
jgi:hypothetical protein